jgi:hypothetical protein
VGPAKHGTRPGNAPEKGFVLFEGVALFDGLVEVAIRARKVLFEPPYVGFGASTDGFGATSSEAVLLGAHHPNDLPSSGEDLLELSGLGVGDVPRGGMASEAGGYESVQGVGLDEPSGGLGEVPRLARVDHEEGDLGSGQGPGERALEASAAGLQDHQKSVGDFRKLAQKKFIDPRLVVGNDEVFVWAGSRATSRAALETSTPT